MQMPSSAHGLKQMAAATTHIASTGGDISGPWVMDVNSGRDDVKPLFNVSPCLTVSRCKTGGHFLFSRGRMMESTEMARLQGIDPSRLRQPETVSKSAFCAMFGNSFTVTVMERLLDRALIAAGFYEKSRDRFGKSSYEATTA